MMDADAYKFRLKEVVSGIVTVIDSKKKPENLDLVHMYVGILEKKIFTF